MLGHPNVSPDWKGTNWYRFGPPAGTKAPDRPPTTSYGGCNTSLQGWIQGIDSLSMNFVLPKICNSLLHLLTISGQPPMEMGETVRATSCFGRDNNDDDGKFKCRYGKEVLIRNCGDFLIYYLPEVNNCDLRYCSI